MASITEPQACIEQEIPAQIKWADTLIRSMHELIIKLEARITPVLSSDRVKPLNGEIEKTPALETEIGNLLNNQNKQIAAANEILEDLCRRVRL